MRTSHIDAERKTPFAWRVFDSKSWNWTRTVTVDLKRSIKKIGVTVVMGAEGSKAVPTKDFETNLVSAVRLAQQKGKFCDLVLLSLTGTKFKVHKVVVYSAFPALRSLLHRLDSFQIVFPDEVVGDLIKYAYTGKLILNKNFLAVLRALLEMAPIDYVRERVCDEVRDHVKNILKDEDAVGKLSSPEMASAVFVAKIYDLPVKKQLLDWRKRQLDSGNNNVTEKYMMLMDYWVDAGKGDALTTYGILGNEDL